jgi:hypothetical protein
MKTKVHLIEVDNPIFIQGDFESQLLVFRLRMLNQVVSIITPFLVFANSHIPTKVHNMLAIMLDPLFKSLKIIQEFVGNLFKAQVIVKEYD